MPEPLRACAVLSLCGWAVYPLVRRLMASLPDRGYAFCRCIGWVLVSWVAWMLAWTTGRPLTPSLSLGSLGLVAALCWGPTLARLGLRGPGSGSADPVARHATGPPQALVACTEGLFFLGMLGLVLLEERNPAVDPDSERFMDYAYLKGCLRASGLPLGDPWLAGAPAVYYHFGYALVAFLVRACRADPGRLFTTAVALPYVLLWLGAFGIGTALTARIRGGLWAAFFVLGAGNLQWLRQGSRALRPALFDWFAPSRVIQGTITEFPWFSLLWGDLHPYVFALPIAVVALALVLAGARGDGAEGLGIVAGRATLLALVVGALLATHPWDYPLVVGVTLVVAACAGGRNAPAGVASVLLASILAWPLFAPFLGGLLVRGHGLAPVATSSHPAEWCLAYGPFLLMGLGLPLIAGGRRRVESAAEETRTSRRTTLALASCALLLALLCEVGYVRDLFEAGPLARMNTVFKVHRIAWLLLALASSSWLEGILAHPPGRPRTARIAGRALIALIVGAALVYPVSGTLAWLRGRALEAQRQSGAERAALLPGAGAEDLFRARMPGDAAAVDFLARAAGARDTLVEETGEPYTWSSRISTFSGVASVLGWGNHEAVWRNGWDEVLRRQADIADIYAHAGSPRACSLLRARGATWIVSGEPERRRYGASVEAFGTVARPRFSGRGTEVYAVADLCAAGP